MNVPFVAFGQQYLDHKDEYDEAITKCLERGKLILQEDVEQFEENLAKFTGVKYAVAVANGTDAITLALKAIGVNGAVIEVPGYTFKATMEAIKHSGNYPQVVDINKNRILNTRGNCIPVHIEGTKSYCPNAIMEDAAQALGSKGIGYSGTASLSFYPAKILGCFGDGGAVITHSKDVADKIKLLRHHWQTNENEEYAYNSRLDNVQAAFLNVKLQYLPEILKRREEIAEKYKELEGVVGLPYYQEGRVWQDYVIEVDEPIKLAEYLKSHGIQTLGYGMTPPHKALNTGQTLENTEKLYSRMIRLPCNETLSNEQVEYVIEKVKDYVSTVS